MNEQGDSCKSTLTQAAAPYKYSEGDSQESAKYSEVDILFYFYFVLSLLLKGRAEDQTNDHPSRSLRRSTKSVISSGLYI